MRLKTSLCLLAATAGLAGCSAEGDRPGMMFLPNMVDSGVVHAFERNPRTPEKPALQAPPEGTIPFDRPVFPYGPGPEEARRAGAELKNPFQGTPEVLARGRQVYVNICSVCHGMRGEGDGPVIGRFPNPPSLQAARAKGLPDGQIVHIITRGQGIMPSHAAQVLIEDRWKAVRYLRQLQGIAPAAPPGAGPAAAETLAGGAQPPAPTGAGDGGSSAAHAAATAGGAR